MTSVEMEKTTTQGSTEGARATAQKDDDCEICYEQYDVDLRVPKLTPCLHKICSVCLEKLSFESGDTQKRCPFCRCLMDMDKCRTNQVLFEELETKNKARLMYSCAERTPVECHICHKQRRLAMNLFVCLTCQPSTLWRLENDDRLGICESLLCEDCTEEHRARHIMQHEQYTCKSLSSIFAYCPEQVKKETEEYVNDINKRDQALHDGALLALFFLWKDFGDTFQHGLLPLPFMSQFGKQIRKVQLKLYDVCVDQHNVIAQQDFCFFVTKIVSWIWPLCSVTDCGKQMHVEWAIGATELLAVVGEVANVFFNDNLREEYWCNYMRNVVIFELPKIAKCRSPVDRHRHRLIVRCVEIGQMFTAKMSDWTVNRLAQIEIAALRKWIGANKRKEGKMARASAYLSQLETLTAVGRFGGVF